jgi:hypothetical protein
MKSNVMILAELRNCLQESKLAFEFMSLYKGVPFSCQAALQRVEGNVAEFKVRPPESVLLRRQSSALMLNDQNIEPLKAQVISFDLQSGLIRLDGFSYVDSKFGNRSEARVEPEVILDVEIRLQDHTFSGQLVDISISGAGVMVFGKGVEGFHRGAEVSFQVLLPGGAAKLPARIQSLEQKDDAVRLAVRFLENAPGQHAVTTYVTQRRREIWQEVQQMYNLSVRENLANNE